MLLNNTFFEVSCHVSMTENYFKNESAYRFFSHQGQSLQQLPGRPKHDRPLLHQRQLEDRLRWRLRDRRNRFPVRPENPARNEEGPSQAPVNVRPGGADISRANQRASLPCGNLNYK